MSIVVPFIKELYPANWLTTIRPLALQRAGYRCQDCKVFNHVNGVREADGSFLELDTLIHNWAIANNKKIIKIHLTVSHQNHDTTDNRASNLRARCQYCHLQFDKELHAISRISKKKLEPLPPYSSLPWL